MRLIDGDALMERLVKKKAGAANKRYTEGFNDALMRFRSMLSTSTTIEAEPVKHGRWLEVQEEQWLVESLVTIGYECSECGNSEGWNKMNYCPNCGAKMNG